MLDKNFLQSFLKVNNASENMSDAEVRKVLETAGWSQTEIDAALSLLRTGVQGSTETIGKPLARFHPDMEFSSNQLSSLLGLDVTIDPENVKRGITGVATSGHIFSDIIFWFFITVLATALAAGMGVGSAYYFQLGPFAV